MLPGKGGKHGPKKGGKGGKESGGKGVPSGSKVKDVPHPPLVKVKIENEEARDSPMGIPIMRVADDSRELPRYTAILARDRDDTVGMDELDALQLELEALLSCSALRHRALLEEIAQLEPSYDRHKKSKISSQKPLNHPPVTPTSLLKRSAARPDNRPPKRIRRDGSKPDLPVGGKIKKPRGPPDAQSPKPDAPEVLKNDLHDKFWASVEPYCRPITIEDITYLQDLIRTREDERNSDLFTIPPLGRHYTLKWNDEDSNDSSVKRPPALGGTAGPMTQRLVAALVEDRSAPQTLPDGDRSREVSASRAAALNHIKSSTFESRVREELREQGILDGDEAPKEQADDELLLEMKRCQSELKALSSHNLQRLRHLLPLAEALLERQELKKRMQEINAELLKIHAVKMEKKELSERESELAWRYIKELKGILNQLYPNSTSST